MLKFQEKSLLKLALIVTLIGILILLFTTQNHTTETTKISSIDNALLGKNIKISGEITSLKDTPSVLIMTLKDGTGSIKVVAFKTKDQIQIKKGSNIEVEGIVKEYNKELEVQATRITLV